MLLVLSKNIKAAGTHLATLPYYLIIPKNNDTNTVGKSKSNLLIIINV